MWGWIILNVELVYWLNGCTFNMFGWEHQLDASTDSVWLRVSVTRIVKYWILDDRILLHQLSSLSSSPGGYHEIGTNLMLVI